MNEEFWRWYMYGHWVCLTQWLGFIKEAFRADMVTLRWEGNTLLFKSFVAGWKNSLRCV